MPRSNVLRTDGRDGRFYLIPDAKGALVRYPSVTTILQAVAKPALVGWAAREERELMTEVAADLYAEAANLPAQLPRSAYILALHGRLGPKKAHQRKLQQAGDIGKQTHTLIEWTLKRQLELPIGPEPAVVDAAQWAFMAFQDWARAVRLRPVWIEQTVYSRAHVYAGTLDLVATLSAPALLAVLAAQGPVAVALADWLRARDEVTATIDFKTGKGIYGEAHLQSVAYQRAFAEMGHGRTDGGLIIRLPKLTTDPGFEVGVVPPARELFPVFLAVRQVWAWLDAQERARRPAAAAEVA